MGGPGAAGGSGGAVIYDQAVPIYEFECDGCGARFEDLVAAGTEEAECRQCGAAGARRRMSSFGMSRQLTPNQRRRLEDKRGVGRDGARRRFKSNLASARERRPKPPRSGSA